jgi:hypothetical protein
MSLVFDHTQSTLSSAMNMSEDQVGNLSIKLAEITKEFICNDEMSKKSHLAEKIALELSYSELLFVVTGKIEEVANKAMEHQLKAQLPQELLNLLEKLKRERDGED